MRIECVFNGPLNQKKYLLDDSEIHEIVYNTSNEYWLSGSGEASIQIKDENHTDSLCIKVCRPYGVKLYYKPYNRDMLVTWREDQAPEFIEVFSGGSYYVEPSNVFISEEDAVLSISHACSTGTLPENVNWKNWIEVEWEE